MAYSSKKGLFAEGFIINPDHFRRTILNISPFQAGDAFVNRSIWINSNSDDNPRVELNGALVSITESATTALEIILTHLAPAPSDEVWIVTTSGNSYVSGCVTRTIERHCKWALAKTSKSSIILVIHEFGYKVNDLTPYLQTGLPVIEDCAYYLYPGINPGCYEPEGDFAIFSMSKMFPMQAGGLLLSPRNALMQESLPPGAVSYFKSCLNHYDAGREQIVARRREIYDKLAKSLEPLGISPRFQVQHGDVPGAFLFKINKEIDYQGLKVFLQEQGVECSVFYGEKAFFIPCHQAMTDHHVNYLSFLINHYLK